jgi:phage terminase small subunit
VFKCSLPLELKVISIFCEEWKIFVEVYKAMKEKLAGRSLR